MNCRLKGNPFEKLLAWLASHAIRYAASLNTTNPCARLPLSTACPTKPSDGSFVLLATTEQDKPLSSPLPVCEDASLRGDHSCPNSVHHQCLSRVRSESLTNASSTSLRPRLATGAASLASS